MKRLIALVILACAATSAAAQPASVRKPPVAQKAATSATEQYFWDPKRAPDGPLFLVIDLNAQRVTVYRQGFLIGASTISTGSEGRETPTGMFTILEKQVMHRSSTYDDAPMPYMQRLTEKGVAIHAGNLPGYAASHGCIRLPPAFAKLLFGATQVGTPVMITDPVQVADQQRKEAEYQQATEQFEQERIQRQLEANRALAEFERAKSAHEKAMRQHEAEVAKYQSETAER